MNYPSNQDMSTSYMDVDCFKSIGYSISYANSISNNWSYLVDVKPTLSSNFDSNINKSDFLLNGGIVFTKKYKNSSFQLGAIKNSSFGFNLTNDIPV